MAKSIKNIASLSDFMKTGLTCCYSNHGPATHVVVEGPKKDQRPLCDACKDDFDLAKDGLKHAPKVRKNA